MLDSFPYKKLRFEIICTGPPSTLLSAPPGPLLLALFWLLSACRPMRAWLKPYWFIALSCGPESLPSSARPDYMGCLRSDNPLSVLLYLLDAALPLLLLMLLTAPLLPPPIMSLSLCIYISLCSFWSGAGYYCWPVPYSDPSIISLPLLCPIPNLICILLLSSYLISLFSYSIEIILSTKFSGSLSISSTISLI